MQPTTLEADFKTAGFSFIDFVEDGGHWLKAWAGPAVNRVHKIAKSHGFKLIMRVDNNMLWKKDDLYIAWVWSPEKWQGLLTYTNKDMVEGVENAPENPIPEPVLHHEREISHNVVMTVAILIGVVIGWVLRSLL